MKLVFLLVFLLAEAAQADDELNWWKTAVFYQIYPRSFKDSNNDGVGDLGGIVGKIDYLVDLGVTAIWLSPIYKSPQVDHGYDISDFMDVDPLFGNLTTLKQLVELCHNRGIKVILDFVPNHTSDQHEWFAKSNQLEDGFENFYIWKDGRENGLPPNNWISHFHGSAWKYSTARNQFYLHQFAAGQPDLNYRDPKLVQEMKNVLTYWLNFGVDGFRMDIVPTLYEHKDFPDEPLSNDPAYTPNDHGYLNHIYTYDQPETYEMVHQWRTLLETYSTTKGGVSKVMMIETYSAKDQALAYYGTAEKMGAHFPFNFWFITQLDGSSKAGDIKRVVETWLNYTDARNFTPNWVLGNHDQHRVASRYGVQRIDGLAMLTLLLPGVAVIYNGEEIGMENGEVTWDQGQDPQACNGLKADFDKNSRDFQRTPFQWDDTVNAGFNEGAQTWLPVGSKYKEVNVKKQVAMAKSHYKVYQALIKTRKNETVKSGKTQLVALNNGGVLVLVRSLADSFYVVLTNIGNNQQSVNLATIANLPDKLSVQIASTNSKKNVGVVLQKASVLLDPYESLVTTGFNNAQFARLSPIIMLLLILIKIAS